MTITKTLDASQANPTAPCYPITGQRAGSPITIHTPSPEAVRSIAERLCKADRAELAALGHRDLHAVVEASLEASREAYVACWDGAPQAVFGVVDYPKDDLLGIPWMLSTGTGKRYAREFMETSRRMIEAWSTMYVGLANIVSADHSSACTWLQALGFKSLKVHHVGERRFIEFGLLSNV